MSHIAYKALKVVGNVFTVLGVALTLFLCILLSGCSTNMVKHELEYQGGKLVLETLVGPAGRHTVHQLLEEYEATDRFKRVVTDIADESREAWFDKKVGQGIMGGGLFGGGGVITALVYFLKKKSDAGDTIQPA